MDRSKGLSREIFYTLKRRGQFGIRIGGDSHCSMQQTKTVLQYLVIIECYKTDGRGFVYAQEDLAGFFDDNTTFLSCENLAADRAHAIYEQLCQNLRSRRVRVTVGISPPPYEGSATAMIGKLNGVSSKDR